MHELDTEFVLQSAWHINEVIEMDHVAIQILALNALCTYAQNT